jgi:nucleoside-triphosphatase THEP1
MVKIVTGKMNSYKTTRLREFYERHPFGDGFVSIKHMQNDRVHHYDLYRLSTQQTHPFIIRDVFLKDDDQEIRYQIGPYCFLESAFQMIEKEIEVMIKNKISPIYIDEIGSLELEGKGFAPIIHQLMALNIDLCVVIREEFIHQVIDYFHIKKFEIIGD